MYVPQTENEASAVILKLKQTEIKFHLERIERQEEEIVKLKEELKEAREFKQITEGTIGKKNIHSDIALLRLAKFGVKLHKFLQG